VRAATTRVPAGACAATEGPALPLSWSLPAGGLVPPPAVTVPLASAARPPNGSSLDGPQPHLRAVRAFAPEVHPPERS